MAWVKFIQDHDYRPRYGVTIAYKAGWTGNIPHAAADEAVAAGKAVRVTRARKGAESEIETRGLTGELAVD